MSENYAKQACHEVQIKIVQFIYFEWIKDHETLVNASNSKEFIRFRIRQTKSVLFKYVVYMLVLVEFEPPTFVLAGERRTTRPGQSGIHLHNVQLYIFNW